MTDRAMIDMNVRARAGAFDLDLNFKSDGKITALFGPSGSGKTSTLRLIAGLNSPTNGHIEIDGSRLFDKAAGINIPARNRHCGFVFQDLALFPHLDVQKNLDYAQRITGRDSVIDFDQIVELLGIGALLDRNIAGLSGGEKQRVALGRCLLSAPKILLLDEPFAALDEDRKREIYPLLEKIRDDLAVPIILVSHSIAEVTRLADQMVVLSGGKVTETGSVEEILSGIRFSEIGILTGRTIANGSDDMFATVDVEGQKIFLNNPDLASGKNVRLNIPSSEVILASEVPRKISAQNCLAVTVSNISELPNATWLLALSIGPQTFKAKITTRALQNMGLKVGDSCYAILKTIALTNHAGL